MAAAQAHTGSFYNAQNKTIEGMLKRIEALESALSYYKELVKFDVSERFVIVEKFTFPQFKTIFNTSTSGLYQAEFNIENFQYDLSSSKIETQNDIFYNDILLYPKGSILKCYNQIQTWNALPTDRFLVVIDLRPEGVYGDIFDHNKLKSNLQGINDNILSVILKSC